MGILGNAVKGSVNDRETGKVLSSDQLKGIQRVLLMILCDIDSICRDNNLRYSLIGGSAIGCVRNQGFIPWDDDVDIAMTRKDYEIFRRIIQDKWNDKYSLTDALRENNFGKNIPKLRLKNTVYKTLLEIAPDDKEINADIFVIENVENNSILKYLHGFRCLAMGFLLSCRRLAENRAFFAEIYNGNDFKIKAAIGKLLSFASLNKWAYWTEKTYSSCHNDNSTLITVPTDRRHFFGEIFQRNIMCDITDMEFEGCNLMLLKEYDYYLSNRYGDYMTVPPADQQVLSVYSELDLGPYADSSYRNK